MTLHQAVDDLQKTNHKKIDQSESEMAKRLWREEEKDWCWPSRWVRRDAYPSSFDPIFRARLPVFKHVQTALLVVSGHGSFRLGVDGIPLSSSGPVDQPFDVTSFMTDDKLLVIGIASGWWDHRAIQGSFIRLLLTHGPNTNNAQVHMTYENGKREVIGRMASK